MRMLKRCSVVAAVGVGAGLLSSPAFAGRCGHSLAVDAPTTFARVARACNVPVSGLREANPGVDPGDVRPGQYLALPDEISGAVQRAEISGGRSGAVSTANAADAGVRYVAYSRGDADMTAPRRSAISLPAWLQNDAPTGGHYSATEGLSYQKASAMRIRAASLRASQATGNNALQPVSITSGDAADRIGNFGALAHAGPIPDTNTLYTVTGVLVDRDGDCVTLATRENGYWELSSSGLEDKIGAQVTVWGAPSAEGCRGSAALKVSHSMFVAPW